MNRDIAYVLQQALIQVLTNPSARLRKCVAPKQCFSGPKTCGENLTNTAVPRHPSCAALPVVTPRMRADSIAGIMRHQLGELYMFAHAPQELAEACEVRPEIAEWLKHTSVYSEAISVLWSRTKPLLDCRAANRALDEAGL